VSFSAFGLRVAARFALPELTELTEDEHDLELILSAPSAAAGAFSGPASPPRVREALLGDGCIFRTERGQHDDFLISYDPRASFHLDASASTVLCDPRDHDDPAWRRFLLDSVLGTAALVRGFVGLHAAATVTEHGLIAVAAGTGGGKSTFTAELLRRGGSLFTDDLVFMRRTDEGVIAHPGPPLMNMALDMPAGLEAAALGQVVAELDGELWTRVTRPPVSPRRLDAIVLLERRTLVGDDDIVVDTLAPSLMPLLPHGLDTSGDAARAARQFELLSDLAEQARLLRVHASMSAVPAALVDSVLGALA